MRTKRLKFTGAVAGVCLLMSACAATFDNHGYVPAEEDLSEIVVGVDTRATVEDLVGTPTSRALLRDEGYYYVRYRVRNFGARRPQVVERQVLAISFAEDGVVQNIERFGLEDGRVITLSRRVTDGGVDNLSFLRQLLGNLGQFDPADAFQ